MLLMTTGLSNIVVSTPSRTAKDLSKIPEAAKYECNVRTFLVLPLENTYIILHIAKTRLREKRTLLVVTSVFRF